jgi:hypothetical protein
MKVVKFLRLSYRSNPGKNTIKYIDDIRYVPHPDNKLPGVIQPVLR